VVLVIPKSLWFKFC